MAPEAAQQRNEIFSFLDEARGFDEAVNDMLRQLLERQRETVMPSENVLSYSHGEGWLAWQQGEKYQTQSFKLLTHEEAMRFQDIIDHNISVLPTFIVRTVEAMHSAFMKTIYDTAHEATERTGNIVDAKQYPSSAHAFLESLRTIEFGVDRQGTVARPEFHLSEEAYDKLVKDVEAEGAEFKKQIEEITAAKEKAALDREAARKRRFVKPCSDR